MSTPINDGGAAFPRPVSFSEEGGTHRGTLGMTLRDYFAGQALNSLIQENATIGREEERDADQEQTAGFLPSFDDLADLQCSAGRIAISAYSIADAMLAARERKEDAP